MTTFKTILQDLINGAGKVNREQFSTDYHYKFFIEALNEIKKIDGVDKIFPTFISYFSFELLDSISDISTFIKKI